ncbi:MAG TPA: MAPEG family protein [Rhizomicrobium sp.]|nr:MAPEG family protein [Rhizomicrobium sp.]
MNAVPDCIIALTFYALWAMFLVLSIGAARVHQVVTGKSEVTGFTAGVPHGPEPYWRLNRAHMNTIENLPIFATVVLSGVAANAVDATFNMLAIIVVCARAVQSLIHIMSGTATAINLRFTAFAVQIVCQMWMAWLILGAAGVF